MSNVIDFGELQRRSATITLAETVEWVITRCDGDLDKAAFVLAGLIKDWPGPDDLCLSLAKYLIATRPTLRMESKP
jgi:hypothetical protein